MILSSSAYSLSDNIGQEELYNLVLKPLTPSLVKSSLKMLKIKCIIPQNYLNCHIRWNIATS